jgi:Asp-tRNA(Asn)/Glu-tRNA(Gln) amidotransferase A subunit family amidase
VGDGLSDLANGSTAGAARAVRRREISPAELLDAYVQRIESLNPSLNALILPRLEEARHEARVAEHAVYSGEELGPLHGVPFTVKEAIEVAGMPCTNGSRLFEGNVSSEDAVAVAHLREAGAILLGKTNVSEFLAHYDSVNLVYGATRNPHDRSRSAGGSSGGEGAAIAAAMPAFGVGSDAGGSIRIPASWDGVFGLKPGRGVVPFTGHFPPDAGVSFQLMAAIGPMARFVEDLELVLSALAWPSVRDPDVEAGTLRPAGPEKPRVAVFEEDGLQPVAAACRQAVRRAAAALEDAGYEVVEERPPNQAEARQLYDVLLVTDLATLAIPQVEGREEQLTPYMRDMVEQLRGFSASLERYVSAFPRLAQLAREASAWLEEHPVALSPVTPVPAPPLEEGITTIDGEPARAGGKMTLCTYANAFGLPAVSVPTGRSPEGLPLAVQLMGGRRSELELLAVARELEETLGGWLEPEL